MTILIGGKKQPTTSLKEKQSGFKLQTPKLQQQKNVAIPEVDIEPNSTDTSATIKSRSNKVVASTANPPNANKLLIDKTKPNNLLASKPVSKTNTIPAMSADKYEVVIDSTSEFSEVAGNKFEEQIIMLQQAIDGTGELKDQMVNILTFLDDNPQYKENVSPKDVAVFVAACRKVAGITVQEKITRKTTKKVVSADVTEVLSDLADLNFEL